MIKKVIKIISIIILIVVATIIFISYKWSNTEIEINNEMQALIINYKEKVISDTTSITISGTISEHLNSSQNYVFNGIISSNALKVDGLDMEPCSLSVINTKSIVGILRYYAPQYDFQYRFYHDDVYKNHLLYSENNRFDKIAILLPDDLVLIAPANTYEEAIKIFDQLF